MASRGHGKNANFSFNAVNIETELNTITQNITVPESDITAFSDAYGNYLAGKKNVSYELAGTLDMAAAGIDVTIFDQIGAGNVSTVFDPTGSGPGADAPQFKCTSSGLTGALVRSYRISLPVGDKATISATIQCSGSTTRATS